MGGMTAEAQVAKKPYRNQTAGWLGVVKLDHLGGQVGISVEPYGTVYLSDEEAILTSRAPKDSKDNPFEEQLFQFQDQAGSIVEKPMRPLVLVTDESGAPREDRFVPGLADATNLGLNAEVAAREDANAVLEAESDRHVETTPVEPTLVPSSAAAVPPSHATRVGAPSTAQPPPPEDDLAAERAQSWVDNPSRTEDPQQGSLGGADGPAPEAPQGTREAVEGTPGTVAPQAPAPQALTATGTVDPPSAPQNAGPVPSESAGTGDQAGAPSEQVTVAEEHAAHIASGEETGAAEQPSGQAPEGEFAAHEEVGSPDAPTQGES